MNFFILFLSAWLFSFNTLASSGRLSNIHVYTNTTPQKLKPAASLLKPAVDLPKLKTASLENSPAAFSDIRLEARTTSSAFEYQTAGIYWLPDYVSKNGGYGYGGRTNENPPSGNNNTCSDYGFEACQAPKTLRPGASPVHPVLGLDCYKKSDCICPTGTGGYNYSSANCSGNKQPSGDTCNDLYKECTCKDGFTYNSTNCKGEYQLAGESCDDNYQRCDPKPCSDGNYSDRTIDGMICSAVIYAGRTCQACRDKTCEEKCSGFQTGVTCAKGQDTETCSSECGSYIKCTGEACPTGIGNCKYGCRTYSTQKDCTDVCLECQTCTPTCTTETNCTYGTETVDNGCGGTCTKCKTPADGCVNDNPIEGDYSCTLCANGKYKCSCVLTTEIPGASYCDLCGNGKYLCTCDINNQYYQKCSDGAIGDSYCTSSCVPYCDGPRYYQTCPTGMICTPSATCPGKFEYDHCDTGYYWPYHSNDPQCSKITCPDGYTLDLTSNQCPNRSDQYSFDSYSSREGITCGKCTTCAERGLKECNGTCISQETCCGTCRSGTSCWYGTCKILKDFSISVDYSNCGLNGTIPTASWVDAVVVDSEGREVDFTHMNVSSSGYSYTTMSVPASGTKIKITTYDAYDCAKVYDDGINWNGCSGNYTKTCQGVVYIEDASYVSIEYSDR